LLETFLSDLAIGLRVANLSNQIVSTFSFAANGTARTVSVVLTLSKTSNKAKGHPTAKKGNHPTH
jgi:hypothetical protein